MLAHIYYISHFFIIFIILLGKYQTISNRQKCLYIIYSEIRLQKATFSGFHTSHVLTGFWARSANRRVATTTCCSTDESGDFLSGIID